MKPGISLETPDELEERLYAVLGRAERCRDGRTHLDLRRGLDQLLQSDRKSGIFISSAKQRPRSACVNPVREHYSHLAASRSRLLMPRRAASRSQSPPSRLPGGARQPGIASVPANSPRTPRRGPTNDFMARYRARKAAERQAILVHRLVGELQDGLQHDELLCISRSPSPGATAATVSNGYSHGTTAATPRTDASRSSPPSSRNNNGSVAAASPGAGSMAVASLRSGRVAVASPRAASSTPFAAVSGSHAGPSSSDWRSSDSTSPAAKAASERSSDVSHSVSSITARNSSVTTTTASRSPLALTTRDPDARPHDQHTSRGSGSYSSHVESSAAQQRSLDAFMNDVRSSRSFDAGAGHTRQTAYPTDALHAQDAELGDGGDLLTSIQALTKGIREQMQLLRSRGG